MKAGFSSLSGINVEQVLGLLHRHPPELHHHVVCPHVVHLCPLRLVVIQLDLLGRILGDEGVNGGKITSRLYTLLDFLH